MAQARTHARRKSLADLIDLADLDTAVNDLLDMNEHEFTRAVRYYLEGDRFGMDAMRDPDVIERTYDTIDRLLRQYRRAYREATEPQRPPLAQMIESLDIERKAIKTEALAERAARIQETQGERDAEYAERTAARLERAAERQRAAREELDRAQRKGIDARALEVLKKNHLAEFLAIRRGLKEQDAADAATERTREDGAGAADPPGGGSTAPGVPVQAARA